MKNTIHFLILVSVILISNNFAQSNYWNSTSGPISSVSGNKIAVYALASLSSGEIFAGTNLNGIFTTTNNGLTWVPASQDVNLSSATISYLVSDSVDNLYAATSNGFYISTDKGVTWVSKMNPTSYQSVSVGNKIIFVGSKFGMNISTDGGNNWTQPALLQNTFVWVIKQKGNFVVAGTMGAGLFISNDNGLTWIKSDSGIESTNVLGLSIDMQNSIIYAGAWNGGVYKSTNMGVSWIKFSDYSSGALFMIGKDVYFGVRGSGIVYSNDLGTTCNEQNSGLTNLLINCFTVGKDGYFYCGSDSGVFVSSKSLISNIGGDKVTTKNFTLYQNYPNPFNPETVIGFNLEKSGFISLKVYDIFGKQIKNLVEGFRKSGLYEVGFNASDLASGVYFYTLKAENFAVSKKMTVLK